MESLIWRFRTRHGALRLHVGIDAALAPELHAELQGCAVVAESLDEFVELASIAIKRAGGILAEVMRQPWSEQPLTNLLRAAAGEPNVVKAAHMILDAATGASPAEQRSLLSDPANGSLLAFISSVASGLDEHRGMFINDLAEVLEISVDELLNALQPLDD